jgi:DNA-binding PadR family transcriptional regulator
MAGGNCRGTKIKLFTGKQAILNRHIMKVLKSSKTPLTKFEIYKIVHGMKGCKKFASGTIYRRINALIEEQHFISVGCKPAKVQGESVLYVLTKKGRAHLRLDERNIEEFLETATEEEFGKFLEFY